MGVGGTISATGSPNFVTALGRPVCFTRLSTARQRALNAEMAMVSLAIGQIYHGHVPWSISAGTQLLDPASHPALRLIGLAAAERPGVPTLDAGLGHDAALADAEETAWTRGRRRRGR